MPKTPTQIKADVNRTFDETPELFHKGSHPEQLIEEWKLNASRHAECALHLGGEFTAVVGAANAYLKIEAPLVWMAREKLIDAERILESIRELAAHAYTYHQRTFRVGEESATVRHKVDEVFNLLETADDLHDRLENHVQHAVRYYQAGIRQGIQIQKSKERGNEP